MITVNSFSPVDLKNDMLSNVDPYRRFIDHAYSEKSMGSANATSIAFHSYLDIYG